MTPCNGLAFCPWGHSHFRLQIPKLGAQQSYETIGPNRLLFYYSTTTDFWSDFWFRIMPSMTVSSDASFIIVQSMLGVKGSCACKWMPCWLCIHFELLSTCIRLPYLFTPWRIMPHLVSTSQKLYLHLWDEWHSDGFHIVKESERKNKC